VPSWKLLLAGDRGRLQREHRDHRAMRPLERHVHPSRVMMLNTTL
jgi:hypothetical protein